MVMRPRGRRGNRAMTYARAGLRLASGVYQGYRRYTALRNRMRSGRTRTTQRHATRESAYNTLTDHNDFRRIYKRRRMPRRQRRRWRNFIKKVSAVKTLDLGTKTQVFYNQGTLDPNENPESQQQVVHLAMYGSRSTVADARSRGFGDLYSMLQAQQPGEEAGYGRSNKWQFRSAIFDVVLKNPGPNILIFEVYEWYMKKRLSQDENQTDVDDGLDTDINDNTDPINGTMNRPELHRKGVSLFAQTQFLSNYGVVITSVRRYLVGAGQYAIFQRRDPKNRWINMADVNENKGYRYPGVTKFLTIVAKTGPAPEEDGSGLLPQTFSWGFTRKYTYKIRPQAEMADEGGYVYGLA